MDDILGKNGIGCVKTVDIVPFWKEKKHQALEDSITFRQFEELEEIKKFREETQKIQRELIAHFEKEFERMYMNPSSRKFAFVDWEDVKENSEKERRRQAYRDILSKTV